MKLEQQVASLELSRRLKELGARQFSQFSWVGIEDLKHDLRFQVNQKEIESYENPKWNFYAAYTVAELGEMLPGNDEQCYFRTQKGLMGNLWFCERVSMVDNKTVKDFNADTEANARAKMLIYLLENKLIEL